MDTRLLKDSGNGLAMRLMLNKMMWQDPIAQYQRQQLVENSTLMSRRALLNGMPDDPRRDIDAECGYPQEIEPEQYRKLYEREPIASRVVQVLPLECWQVTPSVYEDEDVDVVTPFEQAFQELPKSLRGQSWFQDEEGSPIWEAMMRLDILSGIGSFGIALLGIDDGLRMDQPVRGFEDSPQTMTSLQSVYGTEAEYGALSLGPGPEKPKVPYTVNAEENPNERRLGQQENMVSEKEPPQYPEESAGTEFGQEPISRKLLYIRVFDETLVQIVQYESDPNNIRYGQPVMYNITLNDPRTHHGGSGLSQATVRVHWSRIIHVADNLDSSEVFGTPRMKPVYNRLLDLKKLHSGSAEMYWKGAFPGFNLVTHPQLGGDISFDSDDIKNQMEQYMNGLQRYTAFIGSQLNSMAPQVVDPASQIQVQLEAICVRLAVPMRVFMGSERGELASSQDTGTWNDRLKQRQNGYITPRIIVPLIDRLIKMGVLPEPNYVPAEKPYNGEAGEEEMYGNEAEDEDYEGSEDYGDGRDYSGADMPYSDTRNAVPIEEGWEESTEDIPTPMNSRPGTMSSSPPRGGYSVVWPDLSAASDLEKSQRASQLTMALASYVSGGVENVMTLTDYLVHIVGMDESLAHQINENSMMQESSEMMSIDPAMEQQMQEAEIEQMTNPELVPDNIQTGDQHHYEAGSMDREAELENERILADKEQNPVLDKGGQPPEIGKGRFSNKTTESGGVPAKGSLFPRKTTGRKRRGR